MVIINKKNSSKSLRTIFIISLLVISLTAWELIVIYVEADHDSITQSLSAGVTSVFFRDVANTANNTATILVTDASLQAGSATINVNDDAGNLDPLTADTVLASATSTTSGAASATAILTETAINSGSFSGTVVLDSSSPTSGNTLQANFGDDIKGIYDPPDYPESARFTAVITATGPTDVTLTDFFIDDSTLGGAACPYEPVVHAIDVDFTDPSVVTNIDVTFSYANGLLGDPSTNTPNLLRIGFRTSSASGFTEDLNPTCTISCNVATDGHDFGANTVTSISQPSAEEGQYTLGFRTGCPGGGGGGLVRPGLVVNALAGIAGGVGGGGGGGPPGPTITLHALALNDNAVETISMPQEIRDIVLAHDPYTPLEPITDVFEDYDLPLSINGNGFALGDYENTLVTQTIETGEPTEFNIVFYTTSEIAHTSLYFNLGPTRTIAGSDTQVLLYKDKPAEIVDPNGNIASATGSINNEGDLKRVVTFSITFSEDIQWSNSDLVIRAWNDKLSSGDTIVYDAIEIAQPEIVEIADEDIPEPEIQTLKSQYVPIWIKNNAAWWSQELIDDSDFVAGIEYLIQNEIITIQDDQVTASYSSNEIPVWVKNNAGWWSEDLITEKEFIDGLQWLISNGIIEVTET